MVKKLPKAIRSDEFKRLISKVPKTKQLIRISFLLSFGAGLRVSEVVKLQPENIKQNSIEVLSGKGGRDRIVPLPKGWREYMIKILPINKSMRTLERWFKKYAQLAKLSPLLTFHSLRHGFATRMVENGVPISHIQTLLGHSDISTTGIYLKARPVDAIKSYEELF